MVQAMAEYINKQDLLEKVREQQNNIFGVPCIIAEIEKAETVEVVRCKDCDIPHNKWTGCPRLNGLIPPPNHFCACGVRKKQRERKAVQNE